jgi:2-oxoglutarate dehydrogenase complex dehydrogenase (E1) component-like enzyme
VRRVALCSGKVYYDLVGAPQRESIRDVAIVRVEQLYPFPDTRLAEILGRYDQATELVWVQEEPANMGAWSYMRPWLQKLAGDRLTMGYVGRPERASPAEGYKRSHDHQQNQIVAHTFEGTIELPLVDVIVR